MLLEKVTVVNKKLFVVSLLYLFSFVAQANFNFYKDLSLRPVDMEKFGDALTEKIFSEKIEWPEILSFEDKNYKIDYTINSDLTNYVKKRMRYYRSDYASVVVLDNNTGKVLTAIDYTRSTKNFGHSLTFSSTSPAASLFKVITAADLIENSEIDKESMFTYRGRSTTLYKYQLEDKKSKWMRRIPFEKAFAYSNNVVFGKAAIHNTDYKSLATMANKFGFNQDILQVINPGTSKLFSKTNEYGLAELASGFNRKTLISPVHAAVIASIIANNGILIHPTLVDQVHTVEHERKIWEAGFKADRVLSPESSKEMQQMMELTVKRGTARGAFRPWRTKKVMKTLDIGGKTGTITGGIPYGKRDWFISYAKKSDQEEDRGISVAVMIVNLEKWYVKSAVLAKDIIQHYYSTINKN